MATDLIEIDPDQPTSEAIERASAAVRRGKVVAIPTDALYTASARLHADIASRHGLALNVGTTVLPHHAIVPTECPGTLDLDRIVREALQEDDMFTDADRAMLKRVYDHLEAYEPLTWTKRLQLWLAKALSTGVPSADLSGPDVETGQAFDAKTASRR